MKRISPRFLQSATILLIVLGVLFLAISGVLRPAFTTALNPFVAAESWLSSRYLAIYDFITAPRDMATLQRRNADLEDQVSQLQAQVIQLQQQLNESQVLYSLLDFARARPENQYVAAAVIGVDPSPFVRYVFIDKGSDSGIRYGMPVVTQQGLVGRVDAVTATASRVQLINDPASVVNVLLKSVGADAQLVGSVTGDISLEMVAQTVDLQVGELLLTSGLGGTYPPDIVVGQVTTIRKSDNDLFQTAAVQPAVDFGSLRAVLVITNFKPVDITPLLPTQEP